MNEFDQYAKRELKARYYIRYADDFVILNQNKQKLEEILRYITVFLQEKLRLELHPQKVSITTAASGVDFLGWVHFPHHHVLRTVTKRRMKKRLAALAHNQAVRNSYRGLLQHGNAHDLAMQVDL
jgi:hypothetical protein